MTLVRSDQALINVTFTAIGPYEKWSMLECGDNVAEAAVAFPGGMAPLIPLGGFAKPTPLTVEKPWEEALVVLYRRLWARVGLEEVIASYQLLNANKEAYGPVTSYSGILGSLARPNYKAGTSEEARLKITVDISGEIQ